MVKHEWVIDETYGNGRCWDYGERYSGSYVLVNIFRRNVIARYKDEFIGFFDTMKEAAVEVQKRALEEAQSKA